MCLPWSIKAFFAKSFLWTNTVLINLLQPFLKTLMWSPLLWTRPHGIGLLPASLPLCPSPFPHCRSGMDGCTPTNSHPPLFLKPALAHHLPSGHRIHLSASPESWCDRVTKLSWRRSEKWCTLLVFLTLHKEMHVYPQAPSLFLKAEGQRPWGSSGLRD